MILVTATRPDGTEKVRPFKTRREAAQYGVFFFLVDNGYASKLTATQVASIFESTGKAELDGFTFVETIPTKE